MKMPENPEQDPADCMGKEPGRTGIFPAAKSFREKFPQQADSADASLPGFLAGRLQKKNSISPVSLDMWTGGVR